jgi:NADH dehydrogenase [ubiquinone] 1 alpha subcomplex assembly factor 6
MQFWRESVNKVFSGAPPREPISLLLHDTVSALRERGCDGAVSSIRYWLLRLIDTRERYMDNRPFTTLSALEEYAENTYSSLIYMTLAAASIRSMHMDHLASHIGKACGIVAILRSIPVLAVPSAAVRTPAGMEAGPGSSPVLLLPLDITAQTKLKEEDVFRKGPEAPGLEEAVFTVATRAHDHLLTAREMLKNLKAGNSPGHDFEHGGQGAHVYTEEATTDATQNDIRHGFGALLEAIPAADFLARLEKAQFDAFHVPQRHFTLPWRMWKALRRQEV